MNPNKPDQSDKTPPADRRILLALLIVTSIALAWILQPFFEVILWGFIIALLATPMNRHLMQRYKLGQNAAALLTMMVVLWVVVLPLVLISLSLATEASGIY